MANIIHRDIYLLKHPRIEPLYVVYNSAVGIELELMDYMLPDEAAAMAYAQGAKSSDVYSCACGIVDGKLIFAPQPGFFVPGWNHLQVEVMKDGEKIITFNIEANCDRQLSSLGASAPPDQGGGSGNVPPAGTTITATTVANWGFLRAPVQEEQLSEEVQNKLNRIGGGDSPDLNTIVTAVIGALDKYNGEGIE